MRGRKGEGEREEGVEGEEGVGERGEMEEREREEDGGSGREWKGVAARNSERGKGWRERRHWQGTLPKSARADSSPFFAPLQYLDKIGASFFGVKPAEKGSGNPDGGTGGGLGGLLGLLGGGGGGGGAGGGGGLLGMLGGGGGGGGGPGGGFLGKLAEIYIFGM